MQHCVEIEVEISGQGTQELIISTFQPGFESAKKVKRNRTESGIDELHSSRYPENLYNRVSIYGCTVQLFRMYVKNFYSNVNTEPASKSGIMKVRLSLLSFSYACNEEKRSRFNHCNGVGILRDTI
jgi:hypothetical protein